eukprot:scaffold195367_cov21-Tisochrysis_lutea.AAC.3
MAQGCHILDFTVCLVIIAGCAPAHQVVVRVAPSMCAHHDGAERWPPLCKSAEDVGELSVM